MRTVLALSLMLFALLGIPTIPAAAETGAPETETAVVPAGEPSPPKPQSDDKEPAADQADTDADIMRNFSRHRPGACPEGPPCKIED